MVVLLLYIVAGKFNDKKLITLFVIGRKLALSDALDIVSKVYKIPFLIKIFFSLIGLFGKKNLNQNYNEEERFVDQWSQWELHLLNLDNFWQQDQI